MRLFFVGRQVDVTCRLAFAVRRLDLHILKFIGSLLCRACALVPIQQLGPLSSLLVLAGFAYKLDARPSELVSL